MCTDTVGTEARKLLQQKLSLPDLKERAETVKQCSNIAESEMEHYYSSTIDYQTPATISSASATNPSVLHTSCNPVGNQPE